MFLEAIDDQTVESDEFAAVVVRAENPNDVISAATGLTIVDNDGTLYT